jgi:uncharacterized coiled-coil DUF342 family protein
MSDQAEELDQLAEDLRQAAADLHEEAAGLREESFAIEADHQEFLAEIQKPVSALREIAGLPDRDVAEAVDEREPVEG